MTRALAALVAAGLLASCAAHSEGTRAGARTARAGADASEDAVELTLRTADGHMLFVGDLRGKPVLLFLFATFDGVSQAALRPLGRLVRDHPDDVVVIGIAIEPNAAELVDAYVYALHPPFPITYEPDDALESGDTPIGRVESVPTFVMLDALGRPVDRHVGFLSENALDAMLYRARKAVPPEQAARVRKPPPLLGNPE